MPRELILHQLVDWILKIWPLQSEPLLRTFVDGLLEKTKLL